MPIRTTNEFRKFCRKLDELHAMDFCKDELIERDGVFTYSTTARDADNYKAALIVHWNSRTKDIHWDSMHPEVADVIQNLLQEFEPCRQKRKFIVYAKVFVDAANWSDAARAVQKKLDDLQYSIHETARSAQFS